MNELYENTMNSPCPNAGLQTPGTEISAATASNYAYQNQALCEAATANLPSTAVECAQEKKAAEEKVRAEHEAAEAKRKAEWEANQRKKKEARKAALQRIAAMNSSEAQLAAISCAGAQTERLVRRNMKICVAEVVKQKCAEDAEFARQVLNPSKNMMRCFHYITQKALSYLREEAELNRKSGIEDWGSGGDVPDALCYQWAIEYFKDPNAEEDQEKEEKFVPRPYAGKHTNRHKSGNKDKTAAKSASKSQPTPKEKPVSTKEPDPFDQLTFDGRPV